MLPLKSTLFVSTLFWLVGCGGSQNTSTTHQTLTLTQTPYVTSVGKAAHIVTELSLGESPKDVYLLLTNSATQAEKIEIRQKQNRVSDRTKHEKKKQRKSPLLIHAPHFVEQFRKNIPTLLKQEVKPSSTSARKKSSGNQNSLYLDENAAKQAAATVRYTQRVSTSFGDKTLKIWVSDDSFGKSCVKAKCVTQNMVEQLGKSFLKSGSDNDIYDWVTNIYGEEWGPHGDKKLIGERNDITIFLTDIDRDNSTNGGVIGYFYAKDNFLASHMAGSNQRLMFYVDAVLFANGTGHWNIDDFWPKEILSTLAHEFEHMIHFYQKTVLRTQLNTDTWIDEMLAESTEDLVASKIRHSGARGVDYRRGDAGDVGNSKGRYPRFNANNSASLPTWNNRLLDYAKVNAFGAYLLRNYGGANILHNVMHNNYIDKRAITSVTGKPMSVLLKEWGTAVLLSDEDNLVDLPVYNRGDYLPNAYRQSVYQLGSINFFNYTPTPKFTNSNQVEAEGNLYYRVAHGVSGHLTFEVDLGKDVEATLIVKEAKSEL